MTDITPAARQMAADLANEVWIERGTAQGHEPYRPEQFGPDAHLHNQVALARLCARFIAMQEDMAKIELISTPGAAYYMAGPRIHEIAAKYRAEVDPLVEALSKMDLGETWPEAEVAAQFLRAQLAKRGIEIGKAK